MCHDDWGEYIVYSTCSGHKCRVICKCCMRCGRQASTRRANVMHAQGRVWGVRRVEKMSRRRQVQKSVDDQATTANDYNCFDFCCLQFRLLFGCGVCVRVCCVVVAWRLRGHVALVHVSFHRNRHCSHTIFARRRHKRTQPIHEQGIVRCSALLRP